jgi:hypothetical protein
VNVVDKLGISKKVARLKPMIVIIGWESDYLF